MCTSRAPVPNGSIRVWNNNGSFGFVPFEHWEHLSQRTRTNLAQSKKCEGYMEWTQRTWCQSLPADLLLLGWATCWHRSIFWPLKKIWVGSKIYSRNYRCTYFRVFSSTAAARRNDAVTWVHVCKHQPVLGTSRGMAAHTPSSEMLTGWEIAGMRCSLSKLFPSHYATPCPSQHMWNAHTGTGTGKQRLLLCLISQSVICLYTVVHPSHSQWSSARQKKQSFLIPVL